MKNSLLILPFAFLSTFCWSQEFELRSPGGKLTALIEFDKGMHVSVSSNGAGIINLENLSLQTVDKNQDPAQIRVQKVFRRTVNGIIKPEIHEKFSSLVDSYNELEIRVREGFSITFRLFDEGLAYRFSTSSKEDLTIYRETLDIMLEKEDSARFQSSKSFNSAYETPYEHEKLTGIEKGRLCNLPFLIEKSNGSFVMISESDLYGYPGLWLEGTSEARLTAVNPPYPRSFTNTGDAYGQGQVAGTFDYIARVKGPRTYPWRIFAVAANEKDLVANNMVYLLASPCQLDDISWIKPGVVMFDWWAKNNIYGVEFKAGINTETAKYFIDFCAEKGFRYFLFDDGWSSEDDILREIPGLNMLEVTEYGRSKNVDVMLWVIWRTLERQWDEAFDLFDKWGIKGIKVDFMNRDDQLMVEFYEKVARKAAEKMMVVDFHGAYKPCGIRRAYPNVLTREGLIEFEYNGWTDQDNPEHHNLLPYIRMFAGPMDYIPGTMRNSTKENFRPVGDYPMGQGTRAHSLALFVILNSPMTMLPDSPSDYYREKECTEFLEKIPVEWDETRLLEGRISDYTVLARRSGNEWHIGAITDRNERNIDLSTGFLDAGEYKLEAIADGLNASKRAEDYRKIEMNFKAGDLLKLKLEPGGGWVARITPAR
jgi:alpha-glucosidase